MSESKITLEDLKRLYQEQKATNTLPHITRRIDDNARHLVAMRILGPDHQSYWWHAARLCRSLTKQEDINEQ